MVVRCNLIHMAYYSLTWIRSLASRKEVELKQKDHTKRFFSLVLLSVFDEFKAESFYFHSYHPNLSI